VVRYTLVIRSPSGSDNVSYEGIRCNVREVKVYAYGSRGKFHVDANAKWERILLNHSGYRHHNDLREFYFCIPHRHIPYDPEDILRNLKSNPERDQSTGLF